jgi:hypothetical protein
MPLARPIHLPSIDVLPVPDSLNLHDARVAKDFVNDAIISHSDPIGALGARELLRSVRKRILPELRNGLDYAGNLLPREITDVFLGGGAPLDAKACHRA